MSSIKNISLFVPHVFPNFSKEYVANVFSEYGEVDHVDFVAKQNRDGNPFNSVYIHFKSWHDTNSNRNFQTDLLSQRVESEVRVYHDGPWYWIVLPNNAKKHVSGDRKPRIDLGGDKVINMNTPEKSVSKPVCPGAPVKSYAQAVDSAIALTTDWSDTQRQFMTNLNDTCVEVPLDDIDKEAEEIFAQMDEIETELESEDANLVHIDGRYIQAIEGENLWLRDEVAQLRAALLNLDYLYQTEAAKVRALNVSYVNVIPNDENM